MTQAKRPLVTHGLRQVLDASLTQAGFHLDEQVRTALVRYVRLLIRWNRTYNLTAVRNEEQAVRRHVLDSLLIQPYLRGDRFLDIGTGAGLPGLVLALARPADRWVLLDSSAKKTRFCLQAVADLGVCNVEVVRARAEDYVSEAKFSTVTSRAFGRIAQLLRCTHHLVAEGGRVIAMKGRNPGDELEELGAMGDNATVVKVNVPGLDAERRLVIVDLAVRGYSERG